MAKLKKKTLTTRVPQSKSKALVATGTMDKVMVLRIQLQAIRTLGKVLVLWMQLQAIRTIGKSLVL